MKHRIVRVVALALTMGLVAGAEAQHARGSGSGSGTGAGSGSGSGSQQGQPYAGLDKRQVASFSDDEITGLLDGRGMGFALPAELNGYPGPMHILELATELQLTTEQRSAIEAIFGHMKQQARQSGTSYVEAEKALDQAFRERIVDLAALKRLTLEADRLRAEKRFAHLQAHVTARAVLTPDQLQRYAALRGYGTK